MEEPLFFKTKILCKEADVCKCDFMFLLLKGLKFVNDLNASNSSVNKQ
jgi:hypothetical protein